MKKLFRGKNLIPSAILLLGLVISAPFIMGASMETRTADGRRALRPDMVTGQVTVATAGTAQAINVVSEAILIKALDGNSGYIYVGDSSVTSSTGFELSAGEAVELIGFFASGTIYVDASSNGDKVSYVVLN